MNDELFPRKKKRIAVGLQLAPLIDIFVLIIIFFIKGTVMSNATLALPQDLNPARSRSPEGVEPAGQIYLSPKEIHFPMIDEKMSLIEFVQQIDENSIEKLSGQSGKIANKIKKYISQVPDKEKRSGLLVNFLADASLDYKTVFSVAKFFREVGFQNILFVAQGEK